MKRIHIFLIPVFVLLFAFSLITTSCSSGFQNESGEVSFTFTEPVLNRIMARGAENDYKNGVAGIYSGMFDNMQGVVKYYAGFKDDNKLYDDHNIDDKETVPRIKVTLKAGGRTYEKDVEIVQVELSSIGMARNISDAGVEIEDESYYILFAYSNGKYIIQELDMEEKKLMSILSEGTWKFVEENMISVMEDGATEPQDVFVSEKNSFEVEAGGKKIFFSEELADKEFLYHFRYLPVPVSFKNLRVGVKGKVSAEIYAQIPHYGKEVIASGESDSFIIEENTAVTVKLKMKYGFEPEPDYSVSDVVPDTKIALYDYNYSFGDSNIYNYNYYFTDSEITVLPNTSDLGIKMEGYPNSPCFCYDNDGKIYIYSKYDGGNKHEIVTSESRYDVSTLLENKYVNTICFDRKRDNLYIYTHDFDDSYAYLYSCGKYNLSDISNSVKNYNIITTGIADSDIQNEIINCKSIAVYEDVLYIPYVKIIAEENIRKGNLTLIQKSLMETSYDEQTGNFNIQLSNDDLVSFPLFAVLPQNSSPKITDMIYQNGYLYILVSDCYINDSWREDEGFRSRGAVVRFNLSSGDLAVRGWTNEAMDVSETGVYMKKNSNYNTFYYTDAEQKNLFVFDGTKPLNKMYETPISSKYPVLYVPDGGFDLSSSAFYGPKKFIALKPKKLVIADDGVAFYTNNDGALSYRNVNRVVVVDLENFAIEDCYEVPVKYAGGASSDFEGDYKRVLQGEIYISDSSNFYYPQPESSIYVIDNYNENVEAVSEFPNDPRIAIKCSDAE